MKGKCSPRLCGRGRVFVGRDGLCPDVDDPIDCRGGRRLFYTAYGDPICDCPKGQFSFPTPQDDCVTIFTPGSCPSGQILTFDSVGALICSRNNCRRRNNRSIAAAIDDQFQFITTTADDGNCFTHSISCPVSSSFDFDVFNLNASCVPIKKRTELISIVEEKERMDANYDQLFPEFDFYRFVLVHKRNRRQLTTNRRTKFLHSAAGINELNRRQDSITGGIFQVPVALPDPLLNSCRPGSKNGNNFKCANSFV